MSKNLSNFVGGALTLGRKPDWILEILTDEERETILRTFVRLHETSLAVHATFDNQSRGLFRYNGVLYAINERKIDAIKLVREIAGIGLKDAKDFVEGKTMAFDVATYQNLVNAFGDAVKQKD